MKKRLALILLLIFGISTAGVSSRAADGPGFRGTTIVLIRHAEKPLSKADGPGLTLAGQARARSYVNYFSHFAIDGTPLRIDTLVATKDTRGSKRPRLTLTPFSQATRLPIQQPFADADVKALVDWLGEGAPHRSILIAWHHGMIPSLLSALGANPNTLLPQGKWPPQTYDWVIVLSYDDNGRLIMTKRISEPMGLANNR